MSQLENLIYTDSRGKTKSIRFNQNSFENGLHTTIITGRNGTCKSTILRGIVTGISIGNCMVTPTPTAAPLTAEITGFNRHFSSVLSFEYKEVFYNRQRQHSTLGYQSPSRYLERWMSEQDQQGRLHKGRLLEIEKRREPHLGLRIQTAARPY